MQLLRRIRERKIVQWAVVYLAGAWLCLEALGFVADSFGWPPTVARSAILIAAVGFFTALVIAWYHGEKGQQRASGIELLLLGALAIVAGALVFVFGREPGPPGVARVLHDPSPASGPPAVAVVPFNVRGTDMEVWREGLVDLLSINLDGSALRAIDSRTVLARWHERTAGGAEADLEMALAVARATGARHAVLGTAVATGAQVRLAANVRELERGDLVHQVQVDGPADSMIALVDRLSIELLRFLLHEGAPEPRTDLASVTTGSIEALKSFLNGELLYRRGEYESADEAYQRAVAADSNFALAFYRLGLTRGWTEAAGTELSLEPLARADSLANLPRREAGLVRAALAMVRNDATEIDAARVLAQRYPDDPEAWYLLGELYYHHGFAKHVGWAEIEAAFLRAIELDPRWAPHYIHLVDLAYRYHADSVIAADRMARYRELAPESPWNRYYDWLFTLAFADSAARAGVVAELEAAELWDLERVWDRLDHPRFWPVQEQLVNLERIRTGELQPGTLRYLFFGNIMSRGWLAAGLGYLDEAREAGVIGPCDFMYLEATLRIPDYPFEDELAPEAIAQQGADAPEDTVAVVRGLACSALYSAYRGKDEEYRAMRGSLEGMRAALAAIDTSAAQQMSALMRVLDGLEAWLTGDSEAAYERLNDYTAPTPELAIPNLWWGRILLDTGRPQQAIPFFVGERGQPLAHLYLGAAYEALGRDAEARAAYRYFLTWWSEADPGLQPLVDEARQALTGIGARLR